MDQSINRRINRSSHSMTYKSFLLFLLFSLLQSESVNYDILFLPKFSKFITIEVSFIPGRKLQHIAQVTQLFPTRGASNFLLSFLCFFSAVTWRELLSLGSALELESALTMLLWHPRLVNSMERHRMWRFPKSWSSMNQRWVATRKPCEMNRRLRRKPLLRRGNGERKPGKRLDLRARRAFSQRASW